MKNICLNWTISILTGLFALFFLTSAGYIFKISVNPAYMPISFLIFFFTLAFLTCKTEKKYFVKSILAQIIVLFDFIILTGVLCCLIPDASYDGITYHQAMIILLKLGLNPIYDNVSTFTNNQEYVFTSSIPYVENFLKFHETIGANIYNIFGRIELTKITNYIFMLCSLCYCVYTLRNFELSEFKSWFWTFVLIYNPICVYQCLSNYVDGIFYYLFLILIFSLINFTKGFDCNKNLYLTCISTVIFSNLKLTGLFTAVIIALVFLTLYRSKKVIVSFLIATVLIIITGINPYFTNIQKGRNAFYPVIQNSVLDANRDFMVTSYPQGFENKNRLEKFAFSIFAVSKNLSPLINSDDKPRLKIPFTISNDDKFIFEDMRLAGFGYFFSGILLGTLILSPFLRFNNKDDKKIFWTIISIIIISVIGNHEAWWARFVPQFWLLPVLILLFFNINNQNSKKILIPVFTLAIICIINSSIINFQYFDDRIKQTFEYNNYVNNSPKIMYIPRSFPQQNKLFETAPIKLQEYGIKVIYIDE